MMMMMVVVVVMMMTTTTTTMMMMMMMMMMRRKWDTRDTHRHLRTFLPQFILRRRHFRLVAQECTRLVTRDSGVDKHRHNHNHHRRRRHYHPFIAIIIVIVIANVIVWLFPAELILHFLPQGGSSAVWVEGWDGERMLHVDGWNPDGQVGCHWMI